MSIFNRVLGISAAMAAVACAVAGGYDQRNLVSDGFVAADHTDPNLKNPWGIAASPTGPFWVSDNGNGLTTLYNGAGVVQSLVVNVPGAPGLSNGPVTGQVFNGNSTAFKISANGHTSSGLFLFATEDGTISGWAPSVDVGNAHRAVDNSGSGAVYKGLGIGSTGGQSYLYAPNFHNGQIEQYDASFNLVRTITEPNLPVGYAPFNSQVLGNSLYVTYAKTNNGFDEVDGLGLGYVDKFDLNGNFIGRIASNGLLDAPWGLTIAPAGFGAFSGDLLVGNFGDGKIHAYDPNNGTYKGALQDGTGKDIQIDGLWALVNGNGGKGGDLNKVYFTAGINGEADGLIGSFQAVPEPSAFLALGAGLLTVSARRRRR